MEAENQSLAAIMTDLPAGDGLRDIVNETLRTASVEAIKFRRGDYNG